ncbi:hypothetical protein KEM48_009024 [Puccinia striiformis f. sp. tritici PST-130]|nr:hypothetical protein KEM48_009024 [Puccinia striiformis f. sp. tritici PST-130]
MYRCFFVAVVLILQTMANAAPSSSSEAGAHYALTAKGIGSQRDRSMRGQPTVTPRKRWVYWPMAIFRGQVRWNHPQAALSRFPQLHVAYFSSFCRKSCTLWLSSIDP